MKGRLEKREQNKVEIKKGSNRDERRKGTRDGRKSTKE